MTDPIPPTDLTPAATVFEAWAGEDYNDWTGGRTYADLNTAKDNAERDFTALMTADGESVGVLTWKECDHQWKLLDGGSVAEVYIDERPVWSTPSRPLPVGEAIIALVPGAEGAGVKP
jgi:hypothetical protein